MENINSKGFAELSVNDTEMIDGGAFPVLFVIWGVEVTVGHALAEQQLDYVQVELLFLKIR